MTDEPAFNTDAVLPKSLIDLGTFEWPRSETRQTLGHLFAKAKGVVSARFTSDAVDEQDLTPVADTALKTRATEVLAGCLGDLLDRAHLDWVKKPDGVQMRRALITPPSSGNILDDWAQRHGFDILQPDGDLEDLPKEACVIIPRLEAFYGRDYNQLARLFELFTKLTEREANVLVGCNSWGWMFLKQFDDAHLLFEDVKTIPAFNAAALAAILEHVVTGAEDGKTFTSVKSGNPIFARDSDGDLEDPYLQALAGRSLGHPWVAIEMFFHGIAEIDHDADEPSAEKIWVDLPKPCSLPAFGAEPMLFALHALMIHGARPIDDLNALLPHRVPNGTWTELERAGFIDTKDGTARCIPRSYPDIRSELGAAGFNLDEL